jgi:hypothetical protein
MRIPSILLILSNERLSSRFVVRKCEVAKKSCGSFLSTCYSDAMIQTRVNTTPQMNMMERVEQALAQLVADASRRGFYGEAGLTLSVQDGRIQHIRVAIERMIK